MEKQIYNENEVVKALRDEAAKNDKFMAVMYVLANRERSRKNLHIVALQQTMKAQGADFSRDFYEYVIDFLGKLGLGVVKKSPRGRIQALTNISTKLQSIGQAAAGKIERMEKFIPGNTTKFHTLQVPAGIGVKRKDFNVGLRIMINNSPINFNIPKMDAEELGEFISNVTALVNSASGKLRGSV